MKKYRVTVTRLIEEECYIFLNATDPDSASDAALNLIEEIADTIWVRTGCEPHTYGVDKIEDAEHITKET